MKTITLEKVGRKTFAVTHKAYLDAIIDLYPEYKDEAFENYLKIIYKNKTKE